MLKLTICTNDILYQQFAKVINDIFDNYVTYGIYNDDIKNKYKKVNLKANISIDRFKHGCQIGDALVICGDNPNHAAEICSNITKDVCPNDKIVCYGIKDDKIERVFAFALQKITTIPGRIVIDYRNLEESIEERKSIDTMPETSLPELLKKYAEIETFNGLCFSENDIKMNANKDMVIKKIIKAAKVIKE